MSRTRLPSLVAVAAAPLLLACPAKVSDAERKGGAPAVTEDDPRVVRDTDDLYPAESAPNATKNVEGDGLGSGRPDESNGVCRLYAPKLPDPECCPFETGFDAERVKALCGHAIYLGESLQHSCGYHFLPTMDGGLPLAIRVSKTIADTAKDAADAHDERMQYRLKNPEFASTPVPGVEGAYWSAAEGIHWAFVPGWNSVRLVSWTDDACSDDAMAQVIGVIAAAKEPSKGAERPGLLPVARQ